MLKLKRGSNFHDYLNTYFMLYALKGMTCCYGVYILRRWLQRQYDSRWRKTMWLFFQPTMFGPFVRMNQAFKPERD